MNFRVYENGFTRNRRCSAPKISMSFSIAIQSRFRLNDSLGLNSKVERWKSFEMYIEGEDMNEMGARGTSWFSRLIHVQIKSVRWSEWIRMKRSEIWALRFRFSMQLSLTLILTQQNDNKGWSHSGGASESNLPHPFEFQFSKLEN